MEEDFEDEDGEEAEARARARNFLETYPLYSRFNQVFDTYRGNLEIRCPACKRSRPFMPYWSSGGGAGLDIERRVPKHRYVDFGPYRCADCDFALRFWIEIDEEHGWVRKIGQVPSPTDLAAIPREVENALSDEGVGHFRKARLCLSIGYGIASCSYLRRILEDETASLLVLLRDLVEQEEGAGARAVVRIEEAMKSKQFDTKAKLLQASGVVPNSICVEGTNPFRVLHDAFSQALHAKSEDAAVDVATQMVNSLEYVVCELKRRTKVRSAFARSLSNRS